MKNITLTFEDGTQHQYANVPDDVTTDQVMQRASKEFQGAKIKTIDGGKKPSQSTVNTVKKTNNDGLLNTTNNIAKGVASGFADIGDTILNAAVNGGEKVKNLVSDDSPSAIKKWNDDRTKGLDQFNSDNSDSTAFNIAKVGGNTLATLPVGGLLGNGVKAAGTALNTSRLAPLAEALTTSGFKAGGAGIGTRMAGGAITGGASAGLVNPDDTITGAIMGGLLPVGTKALGMTGGLIGDVYNEGKKLIQPFSATGRKNLLIENLIKLLGDKAGNIAINLKNAKGYTQGFNPTAGQAGGSAELAAFERMIKNRNPGMFEDVANSQNQSLADAAHGLGGDEFTRNALVGARNDAVEGLYSQAKSKMIPSDDMLEELLKRPAINSAMGFAGRNMQNQGKAISHGGVELPPLAGDIGSYFDQETGKRLFTGDVLHEIKLALDAQKNIMPNSAADAAGLRGVRSASDSFNEYLDNAIPEYGHAKNTYADMSKRINQLDIGNAIRDKFIPAQYKDMPVPPALNRATLAKVMRDNGDNMAQSVTGYKGATLDGTLSAQQKQTLDNIFKDNETYLMGEMLGKSTGSPTYQHLAMNGKGEQIGLLKSLLSGVMNNPIGGVIKGVRDMAYKAPLEQLDVDLAKMLQSPNNTGALIESFLNKQNKAPLVNPNFMEAIKQATYKSLPVMSAQ